MSFCRDKRNCPYKRGVRIKRVSVERGSTVIIILFTCGDVWVVPMTPAPKQYTVLHSLHKITKIALVNFTK